MALSANPHRHKDMNVFLANVFFELGKRVGEQIAWLIETQAAQSNPKLPSIFDAIPPMRKDIEALLIKHAKARWETYEFYRKRIALIVPPLPTGDDTTESIRAKNLVAWEYFFTQCPITIVKKVLDLFDRSRTGWVNPQEVSILLAH